MGFAAACYLRRPPCALADVQCKKILGDADTVHETSSAFKGYDEVRDTNRWHSQPSSSTYVGVGMHLGKVREGPSHGLLPSYLESRVGGKMI